MTLAKFIKARGALDPAATRLAFITDLHIQNRAPRMRKDNYAQALLEKLNWVCKTAKSLGCEKTILGGGDIFDVPVLNLERADDFADILIHHDITMATAFGNHDVESTLATSNRSVLGHMMRRSPNIIRPLPILAAPPLQIKDIHIWGHHYRYLNHRDYEPPKENEEDHRGITLEPTIADISATRVIVSHSMILKDQPVFEPWQYTLFDEVHTNAQVILLGHYHPQQMMYKLSNPYGTLIGGPGAMMRGALSRDDLNRKPAMAILQVRKVAGMPPEISVDFIDIEVAAPASEVFKLEEARAEVQKSEALDAFRSNLDSLKVQGFSIPALIEEIAKNEHISDEVKAEALRRIGVQP